MSYLGSYSEYEMEEAVSALPLPSSAYILKEFNTLELMAVACRLMFVVKQRIEQEVVLAESQEKARMVTAYLCPRFLAAVSYCDCNSISERNAWFLAGKLLKNMVDHLLLIDGRYTPTLNAYLVRRYSMLWVLDYHPSCLGAAKLRIEWLKRLLIAFDGAYDELVSAPNNWQSKFI